MIVKCSLFFLAADSKVYIVCLNAYPCENMSFPL